ncbi:MAG: hypothetical protein EB034_00115 [Verrucomicrobia bacterium]|nr:hypothetical protein [Verrucomicrobiota bacterium]
MFVEHLQVEPEVGDFERGRLALLAAELVRGRRSRADVVDGLGVRTDGGQRCGGAGLVGDLHEELLPAVLRQLGLGVTLRDLHAHLGIDVHAKERVAVEHCLEFYDGGLLIGRFHGGIERRLVRRAERGTEIIRGFNEPPHLGDERLPLDTLDNRQRGGADGERQDGKQDKGKQGRAHKRLG